MSKRIDVEYHNRKVQVQSQWIGHDVGHVKQGYWICFRMPGETAIHTGRSLGTVSTTGTDDPHIKDWIVAVTISPTSDCALERWIDPVWVIRSTPFPPTRLFEFMCSDFSDRAAVIQRVDDGVPSGFKHYYNEPIPKPDPRWTPARLVTKDEPYTDYNLMVTTLNKLPVVVTGPGDYKTRNGRRVTVHSVDPVTDLTTTAFGAKGSLWKTESEMGTNPEYQIWHVSGRLVTYRQKALDIVSNWESPK